MANVVAKLLYKMNLVAKPSVVFVNNSLELLGSYVGQTPQKVDDKVSEAKGGVLFIDEAYSIVKDQHASSSSSAGFGKEAIDTLMKHLDPPSCVMIFAGYSDRMEDFLNTNPGLARRIPYRYEFTAYTQEQLMKIFTVMAENKGETLSEAVVIELPHLLASLPESLIEHQNAGLISNWLSFAQLQRDDRIDLNEAEKQPQLASTLEVCDIQGARDKLISMSGNAQSQLRPKIK
jgi:stage V sporulation protein K